MPKKPDTTPTVNPAFDPKIQTENIAYAATELTWCGACGRQNPPTRLKCLYCGHELEIPDENLVRIKPIIRPMESWERGFNVIFQKKKVRAKISVSEVASLIAQTDEFVEAILATGKMLPLARVESVKDAEIMTARLGNLGLICQIVSDETLAADQPPVRLAGIEIEKASVTFVAFFTNSPTKVMLKDVRLIVPGFLSESKIDLVEKRKLKGAEIQDEVESSVHEALVDIYTRSDRRGYRVQLAGFDFSCLGAEKGFLAAENIKKLVGLLTKITPKAKLVDDYAQSRRVLGHVWEVERRSEPQGMRRLGFGKTGLQKVETTSNLQQFTRYSRLQFKLYDQEGVAKVAKKKTASTGNAVPAKEKDAAEKTTRAGRAAAPRKATTQLKTTTAGKPTSAGQKRVSKPGTKPE